MGTGSSAEQRSPQDGATAAGESQPGSPEAETPPEVLAEPEPLEDPAKVEQTNEQVSSNNGVSEQLLELSLKPEELNGQQAEEIVTDVGQRETPNVILKEEPAENIETKTPESTDKTNVGDVPKDLSDADKQLPTSEEKAEEQELPSVSSANDVGFRKAFKFVGVRFTSRKHKIEPAEPAQLLNVKADDTEAAADGAGDSKDVKMEEAEETIQSKVSHLVQKTEQQTPTEQVKEEASSEKVKESYVEPTEGSKEAEVKSDSSKLLESLSPLETASPLRKFFTQGWAGFRKRTSFKKTKGDDQPADKEKQDREKEIAEEENAIKEELEKEETAPEKDGTEISVELTDKTVKKAEEGEEIKMRDVSTETNQEEPITPPSQESVKSVNEESEICLTEKIALPSKEISEPMQECLPSLEQSTLALSEKEHAIPLTKEVSEEKLETCEPASPLTMEKTEEDFEVLEDKLESKAPLATENFDETHSEFNNDVSTIVEREEVKTNEKEELTLEQLVEADAQRGQSADEQLKVKQTIPEAMTEQTKQTEQSSGDAATSKPPEGITNEAELLSSQERAKIQGSPLKKLFTSTSLKKLSGKKHQVRREESKSGESVEQRQQLTDSAESPEEQKGESSASSPEETMELSTVEKVTDIVQVTETEEGATSDMEKKRETVTPWASFKKMVTPKKLVRKLSETDKEEEELEKAKTTTLFSSESAPCEEQEDNKENGEEQKLEKSPDEPKKKVDTSVSWEALLCVGSSKKRARKSSSSDEEVGQRLAQEGQKMDENGTHKEETPDMTFTSSQESDQGQGNSSPEQAGSPSESEGVSTWESFKRLVTPRRKSKTKMEDRPEEVATVPSSEQSPSDGDSGKEESWVSLKKLMPGRRKKKSDGIPEHAPVKEVREEITENNEEDYDVPAVVPLAEYEAAEQEKFEAQKAKEDDVTKKRTLDERMEMSRDALVDEQSSEELVHAVTVTVVEGERAVTSIEERSPSWISAAMTELTEHTEEDKEKQTEETSETGIGEEKAVVTKPMPEIRKHISGDITEMSFAEETTEMVSAVSRLSETSDTTEVATPVQEVEGQQNLDELNKETEEVLQGEVKESGLKQKLYKSTDSFGEEKERAKERLPYTHVADETGSEQESDEEITKEQASQENSDEEDFDIQTEGTESDQSQGEVKESGLKQKLYKSTDSFGEEKERAKERLPYTHVADETGSEQESDEEITKEQTSEENSDKEDFDIQTESTESDQSQVEFKGCGLKQKLDKSTNSFGEEKERTKERLPYRHMADETGSEQESDEEFTKEQTSEENSDEEDFDFGTVTSDEEPEIKVVETIEEQQHISSEAISEPSLRKENGETKLESEVDAAIPTETDRMTVEGTVPGDLPEESFDISQPKLKGVAAGQTIQVQEHSTKWQTPAKRKEEQSSGIGKTHTEEDGNNQDFPVRVSC